jgi:hypothetical protein
MRNYLIVFTFLLGFFFVTGNLFAQQTTGTVEITTSLEGVTDYHGYSLRLFESSTHRRFGEYEVSAAGTATIHDLPFGNYSIWLMASGDAITLQQQVSVHSTVPIKLALSKGQVVNPVVVEAQLPDISRPVVKTVFPASEIAGLPAPSSAMKMEAVLLNTPGVVPDEDGRLHMRGEDAQIQYVVDGIPIFTNQTEVYSSLFNAGLIKSADIIRGGFNAEYGVALSGVVNVHTRSGFDHPVFADGTVSYGSFGTKDRSLSLGGNIDNRAALFFSYGSSETKRYLDPIRSFEPNHTDGYTHNYFAKADFLITDDIDLVLIGTTNLANFGIANALERTPSQDQRQSVSDFMFAGRLNFDLTDKSTLSLLGYKRRVEATNTSGGLMRLSLPVDSAKAVSENEDFFIGANRVDQALGGQLEYSVLTNWFDAPNTIKFGASGESFPLKEFFTFAVVNPALSTPAGEPGGSESGDDRLAPYDLTKGGTPFLVDQSKTGNRISAYVQDQIAFKDLIVNAGLRFDRFSLFDDETAISPRLSAAYRVNDDLWLRGSYNRIVMQAPIENILVSSSDEAAQLVGSEQGGVPTRVSSEKEHVLELGASYKLNDNIDLDLNTYAKFIEDFIVKVELGVSGIIFPVNLKEGQVFGGDLELRLHNWNNLSGKLSVGSCISMGKKPEDGTSPIAAGLILGEEGENYSHPFGGEDVFPTEHNQLLTASFVFNYDHPSGFFAILGGRFDSGLPFDLADSAGNGLDATAARAELKRRGYTDDVIDLLALEGEVENGKISPDKSVAPHFILDAGVGFDFQPELKIPAKISVGILNVLDTKYLYKFESSFGGTHFGLPRMITVGLQVKL